MQFTWVPGVGAPQKADEVHWQTHNSIFLSLQLQLVGMRMILTKVFLDQVAYWAPVINAIYLFS